MKTKLTPIAAAAAVALAGAMAPAFAQSAAPAPAAAASAAAAAKVAGGPDEAVQRVEVTGIRGSLQQSLNQKRNSATHVEVITAEDVGKLPDKNIADSLQHVPGITISSAGANEGGFDESDRVSMRGTSPSLTQTLINGHEVASADWFVLDQSTTVGRSVSYTLLPAELVGSVVVHKSSQASLVEGGVAGSVDIITRKPLDAKKQLEVEVTAGAVYASLPSKTDPQLSALVNWKNDASTFGVLLQAFSETRHLRRDGVEELGYEQIKAGSPIALAHPDLSGVYYPESIGSALFEQTRKRTGGLIDVEVKPNSDTTLDFNVFHSNMQASNYNRNYLLWATHFINQGQGQAPNPGYVVQNNTLVSASFANDGTTQHGIYDEISRPGEGAETGYFDFDGAFRLSDKLNIASKIGFSNAIGKTPTQDVLEADIKGTGAQYQLNGINSAPNFSLPGGNNTTPFGGNASLDWIFGDENVRVQDKENWQQLDGDYAIEAGPLTSLKFGVRATDHTRQSLHVVAQGPISNPTTGLSPFDTANWPQTFQNYPGNFGDGLGGSPIQDVWFYSPAQLAAFDKLYTNRDPSTREYYPDEYSVRETTQAAYLQGNLEGSKWSGDVGLRLVGTGEHVLSFQPAQATTPGALLNSAFGPFVPVTTNHNYTDVLPSANLRFDLAKDLVGRVAASKTMTRADYSALSGTVSLTPPAVAGGQGSGTGGNPDLKPITSNNLDTSLEWYFAERALLSASLFYMDLTNYIGYGQVNKTYKTFDTNNPNGALVDYLLTTPVNSKGKVKGVELAWEQPIFGNFGAMANYTYTDAHENGGFALVGASKNTYNVGGYFENDFFSARVSYNHRSSFYSGLDRETAFYQAAVGDLSGSVSYTISKNFKITLDGRNLNNPKLKYYALNQSEPRSIYENGRQYYLTAHYSY